MSFGVTNNRYNSASISRADCDNEDLHLNPVRTLPESLRIATSLVGDSGNNHYDSGIELASPSMNSPTGMSHHQSAELEFDSPTNKKSATPLATSRRLNIKSTLKRWRDIEKAVVSLYRFNGRMLIFTLLSCCAYIPWLAGGSSLLWVLFPLAFWLIIVIIISMKTLHTYSKGSSTLISTRLVSRFLNSFAELLGLDDDVRDNRIPQWILLALLIANLFMAVLFEVGLHQMHQIYYVSCNGLENYIATAKCGNLPIGAIYHNTTVTLQLYNRGPFGGLNYPVELTVHGILLQQMFIIYYIWSFALSICLAWEIEEVISIENRNNLQFCSNCIPNDKNQQASMFSILPFKQYEKDAVFIQASLKWKQSWRDIKNGLNPWYAGSGCISFGFALWGPVYLLSYYSNLITRLDSILIIVAILFFTGSMYSVCIILQFPYLEYYRNYLYMLAISHTEYNLLNPIELRYWYQLRNYYVYQMMPLNYGIAQWSFMSLLLLAVGTSIGVIIVVLFQGREVLLYFGAQTLLTAVILASIITYILMSRALKIWQVQESHIELLREYQLMMRMLNYENSATTTDGEFKLQPLSHSAAADLELNSKYTSNQLDKQLLLMDEICDYITAHDVPPKAFGVSLKPTLFHILIGYFTSAFIVLMTKYFVY